MVKKLFVILACVCLCGIIQGQIRVKKEVSDAELTSLKTEFEELAKRKEVQKAVEKGALLSELFIFSKRYDEAGDVCAQMDNLIYPYDRQTGKTSFLLHFLVAKERLRLYTQELNYQRSKTQLNQMNYCMQHMEDDSYTDDALLVKAQYYHAFGMKEKSLECFEMLLQRCLSERNDADKEDCFKNMIAYATQDKNIELGEIVQNKYAAWQDSIQMVRAAKELEILKTTHEQLQYDLGEKEKTIRKDQMIITGLWGFIVAMVAVLLVLLFLFLRNMYRIRKLKKNLEMANDHNARKSTFISNIKSQIMPDLDGMEKDLEYSSASAIRGRLTDMKKNVVDMQSYISLEEALEEAYPVKDIDVSQFCDRVMEKVRPAVYAGVEVVVSAPRVSIKTNAEALEHILDYLLSRSALYTENGKIILEFKKRNARTGQFIVTDTGVPVDPALQDILFKPFATSESTAKGDKWGLPICSLIAHRLNGTLTVDPEYKRGTRFILNLCS